MGKRYTKEEVEKNFEVIETKVKRDKHPNEWKYPGRNGNEHKMALLQYLKNLTAEQRISFKAGQLILDKEKTKTFFDEIAVNDVVGIKDTVYKVVSKNNDIIVGNILKTEKNVNIDMPALDFALSTGFGEILWRNDKPYGFDEEETIKIYLPKAKEENSQNSSEKE